MSQRFPAAQRFITLFKCWKYAAIDFIASVFTAEQRILEVYSCQRNIQENIKKDQFSLKSYLKSRFIEIVPREGFCCSQSAVKTRVAWFCLRNVPFLAFLGS